MWKVIVNEPETKFGPSWTWLDMSSRHALHKVASTGVFVPPELQAKIAEIQGHLPGDKVAFYNRALGSYEAFGLNRNGDGFEADWLRRNHDTFVKNGHYFKHHQNKDPALGRGRPVASAYNEKTAMVDLIIVADKDKCEEQIQALERGQRVPTSMGAKVAFDVCTICENRAPNRDSYCEHVKTAAMEPYGMSRVLPDGRVCGVLNPNPGFFDISDVIVGAAAESETLMKVASHGKLSGADLAVLTGLSKIGDEKGAAMSKRLPGEIDAAYHPLSSRADDISSREIDIPDADIDRVRERSGFEGVLRNSAALGIVLKPSEFARAAKLSSFSAPTLKEILRSESAPKKILTAALDEGSLQILSRFYDQRSSQQPVLMNRISSPGQKIASRREGESADAKRMYCAYRRALLDVDSEDTAWSMKCAGTSDRYRTETSRAYTLHVFTEPEIREKVLDRIMKVAGQSRGTGFGPISGSMADELGVEVLELLAVQSIQTF